jgi:hypothetical protein
VRRAGGGTDDCCLGDRRIDDAFLAEPTEKPVRDLEGAAIRADILAEDEDPLVAPLPEPYAA